MKKINYDELSQIYDLSRNANSSTTKDLVKLTKITSSSLILDMGCGTGNYTASLKNYTRWIIGLDISHGMITKARNKFTHLDLINGDVIYLPFKQEIFSGLYIIQVLHHIKDKLKLFEEGKRVLKPNGYLSIHTCSHEQLKSVWYYHYFKEGLKKDLNRIPDIMEIKSLLIKTGYTNIKVYSCHEDPVILNQSPENYLDKKYRAGDSTFALLTEKETILGCDRLKKDIKSGVISEIIGDYNKRARINGGSTIIYCQNN